MLLMLFSGTPAAADLYEVTAGRSHLSFDKVTGDIVGWQICERACSDPAARRDDLLTPASGKFRITDGILPGAPIVFRTTAQPEFAEVSLESGTARRVLRLYKDSARAELELAAGSAVRIASGDDFIPEALPGIGVIYSRVQGVGVADDGQTTVAYGENEPALSITADAAQWTGVRNRYWTWLARPQAGSLAAEFSYDAANRPVLEIKLADAEAAMQLELYAGPVEWRQLRAVAPVLSEMLFAALWDFLRWLCFGMLILLDWLHRVVGNYGIAIVLLSLSAKILMTPLTRLADRWQSEVNQINSLLQPEIAAIRKKYKGEDAHNRTLAVFKKHGVSQWYTFKSAAGFLIQIPVFIAAFDMLAENFALNEIAFLWVSDLAKPDQFAPLPFVIPFFGGWLNVLPFLMSGLSLLAAWLQNEDSLTPELQRQQSIRLYLMAFAFFILFYTFPAGMVLYWTASNLFHLLKVEALPLLSRLLGR
jgi:YidC/Oxa1 family membrane protein insertase